MPPRPAARDEWLLPTLVTLLSPEQAALLREGTHASYWEAAVRAGHVTDDAILAALAERFRMRVANVSMVSQQSRELVPESLARRYRILPLAISDSVLDIATADPHDLDCERTLAFATGRTVRMSLAAPGRIVERIDEVYRPENAVEKILQNVAGNYEVQALAEAEESAELDIAGEKANERPIIRLVDHIIAEGITTRASDIHLEPEESGVVVRYRIDGVLRHGLALPRATGVPLVSRIKIIASLDIADRLRPQDGRARVMVNGNRVDLRISTLPTSQGEKVVVRILDSRGTLLSLDGLGLSAHERERIDHLLSLREGVVLVTGPTGSGKTTTLYSALKQIQGRGVNIVTVEDPVEYKLAGIVQVQVHEKAGLTFASALRSILRQDPDVVLIGEIRDKETAMIAVQASLTGHLVFSTLHTIDAASSVTRLMDIGVESYKLSAALKGVVAQRLLRRLCSQCRIADGPAPERLRPWLPESATLYRGVGCAECAQTGYRGRLAITEVLVTTPEVERCIATNASASQITEAARASGMQTLWDAGVRHAIAGTTSVEELLRVLEAPPVPGTAPTRPAPSAPPPPPAPEALAVAEPVIRTRRRAPEVVLPPLPETPIGRGAAFDLVDDFSAGVAADGTAQLRVLLVDDDADLRALMRTLLTAEGLEVAEAADGVAALDAIDRHAPDLVVLDLDMPRLDGHAVLASLRSRPATSRLPVLVLTAQGDESSETRVFDEGANDFLVKPFRPRAFGARVRAMLRRQQLEEA